LRGKIDNFVTKSTIQAIKDKIWKKKYFIY
jgi:hypothetical protein